MYKLSIINFYLSWLCNHRCIHCWVEGNSEEIIHLDSDICIDILSKSLPLGLKSVKITGGEPLMHMDVVTSIINWCVKHSIYVVMETNGSLLTEDFINKYLKNKNIDIAVSLNGYNSETHDQFVVQRGSFDKVMSNISILHKNNIKFQIITSIFKDNIFDIEKIIALCKGVNPSMLKINPIIDIGRGTVLFKKKKLLNYSDISSLVALTDFYSKKYNIKVFLHIPPALRSIAALKCFGCTICSYLNMLSLLPDKSLALCGYGGVNKDAIWGKYSFSLNLKDFWENNKKIEILRNIETSEGVCQKCIHQKICRGDCKAIAFNYYNRWDAPNPDCQKLFDNGIFPKTRLILDKEI